MLAAAQVAVRGSAAALGSADEVQLLSVCLLLEEAAAEKEKAHKKDLAAAENAVASLPSLRKGPPEGPPDAAMSH